MESEYMTERRKFVAEVRAFVDRVTPEEIWTLMTDQQKAKLLESVGWSIEMSDDHNMSVSNAAGELFGSAGVGKRWDLGKDLLDLSAELKKGDV